MSQKPRILFISRGRGRGHAIPDHSIGRHLKHKGYDVVFASYATGYETLADLGNEVFDMELPDNAPYEETFVAAYEAIKYIPAALVVIHEEFSAAQAASVLAPRSVFIIDWFYEEDHPHMKILNNCLSILFIEREGIYECPSYLGNKTIYCGRVRDRIEIIVQDCKRILNRHGIEDSDWIISVIPGAWAYEERIALEEILIPSFEMVEAKSKRLVWVAGRDFERLQRKYRENESITILKSFEPIEYLMASSRIAITKGNRGSTMILDEIGVPSLSLSPGTNPVDDRYLEHIATSVRLHLGSVTVHNIANLITCHSKNEGLQRHLILPELNGALNAAAHISNSYSL